MNPNVNPPLKPGQIYLVDGGFSTQLSKYLGAEAVDRDPLWTARSLIESPDIVCRVHRDFLASRYRRDVVGFSRQQCSPWRFSFWYCVFCVIRYLCAYEAMRGTRVGSERGEIEGQLELIC